MDVAERQRQNESSRAKVEALLAERQPARRGKSRQSANKLEQLQRRQARLADRQQPLFCTLIQLPAGTSLPLSPRWRSWIGGLVASQSLNIREQGHSIAIARRGEPVPESVVDAIHDHAGGLAAWLRSCSCPDCDRPAQIQPALEATAGASWHLACPRCGDVIHL